MFTTIDQTEQGLVLQGPRVELFEPAHTFECGQCFRWNRTSDNNHIGVVNGKVARVFKKAGKLHIIGASMEEADFWLDYLDLNRDYAAVRNAFCEDPVLVQAMEYGFGLQILNQPQFETIISFILSANKRFDLIKSSVERVSSMFGDRLAFEGNEYFSFPTPQQLLGASIEQLYECGCGYRAPYLAATSKTIATGGFDIEATMAMELTQAHSELTTLSGIGPKVADCILLFSMKKSQAFPVDVWVKRVMQHYYTTPEMGLKQIRAFGMDKFGIHAGIAQQYLFFYARENKIGVK